MIRLTGPKWDPDEEVVTTARHDKQKFKVEDLLDYVVGDDGMEQLVTKIKYVFQCTIKKYILVNGKKRRTKM